MDSNIEKLIDDTLNLTAGKLKTGINDLLNTAKNDSNQFIKDRGDDLEKYLKELALGQITQNQFETLVQGLKILIESEMQVLSIESKKSAKALIEGIIASIVGQLIKSLNYN